MQNHYLEVLELSPGASKQEVKAAYRRLSKRYHPDISQDPATQQRFIEITEAYNFLTKVGPRPHQEEVAFDYDPQAAEFERRRRQARDWARQKVAEEIRLKAFYFGQILKYFNYLALLMAVANLSLLTDYLLPATTYSQLVQYERPVYESRGSGSIRQRVHRYNELVFQDFRMVFELDDLRGVNLQGSVAVEATPLFEVPVRAWFGQGGERQPVEPAYSIYSVFGYLIPISLLVLALYQFYITNPEHRLTLAILLVFLFCIQLVVLAFA